MDAAATAETNEYAASDAAHRLTAPYTWQQEYAFDSGGYMFTDTGPVYAQPDVDEESFALGFDIKFTRTGPKIIEFHVNDDFKTEGFKTAFQYGDITPLRNEGSGGQFQDYLHAHARWKDATHDLIGEYMPDQVTRSDELDDEELVVSKPVNTDKGYGVEVERWADTSLPGRFNLFRRPAQIERFEEGRPIYHNGRPYDPCMRYVLNGRIEDDQLVLQDLGGYWRTPEKPIDDPFATLSEKHVANLSRNGNAVPATSSDLYLASRTAAAATRDMFDQWIDETDINLNVAPPFQPRHADLY